MTKPVLLGLSAMLACTHAAVDADAIDGRSLPGYNRPLPHMHYSGYIQTTLPGGKGDAHTHYWLVLADNVMAAPVVVWQQGGPGGSSLLGLLTENGPLTLNDASFAHNGTAPTVFDNPNGWHGENTMLYVEHPAPTGFSYCGSSGTDCVHDDETQAQLAYSFYVKFFELYPELQRQPFYFTGESYAGVLVPTLSLKLLAARTDANRHLAPWSISGFALGNDCPGNRVFTCTPYSGWAGTQVSLDFLAGHGMIPEAKKKQIDAACASWYEEAPPGPYGPPPADCRALLEDPIRPVKSIAGDTYDMGGGYFLYDTCGTDLSALDSATSRPRQGVQPKPPQRSIALAAYDRWAQPKVQINADGAAETVSRLREGYPNTAGEYACGQENAAVIWLNLPEVPEALHVKLVGKTEFSISTGLHYNFTAYSLLDVYNSTLTKELRIMQFSGDADPCVPYVGTERWIESLHMKVSVPWRPWTAPNTMPVSGYVTTFDTSGGGFTFTTMRNAGHMVPRYKPKESKYMISKWLKGEKL